ncbi:hypothetical protein [Ammoniphilus sp. CFH 90114]|uniref:hypothetical protein n=1 Tax=Ammoniphilus sp. CFH 90114 TaxID=2493665 RepID=UPI00100ED486|nr:hypothetical protein [Ammoniphilus sp. CFH 90114]RXT14640.1 hypothetical protein EIZ39_00010 [Ammoniphilus sp. CFH 90114]
MTSVLLLLYCLYLYFFHRLLVIPALAEFSYYGLLVVPLALLMFWLIPQEARKKAIVYTFLFLLLDQSMENAFRELDFIPFILSVGFIFLFLFPISRWYAQIRLSAFTIALAVALVLNVALPHKTVQMLPYFYKVWNSEQLYIGERTSYFSIIARDIDGDGKEEIITLGNAEEVKATLDPSKPIVPTYILDEEPLSLYVYKWDNGQMNRIPQEQLDRERIVALLPKEYIGFPYYTLNERLELEPLIQRQPLTEGMMQFGTAPYRAMLLNIENIEQELAKNDGAYDKKDQVGTKYQGVTLKNGYLSGTYADSFFQTPSPATRIIDAIKLGDGHEGLLVLGSDVHLLQMVDGKMTVTHELTRDMHKGLAQSQYKMVDLNNDGKEEIMLKHPYSTLLSPEADGTWKILWNTEERSFRFEDYLKTGNQHELVGLSKSAVRAKDTRYLTGFRFTEEGLAQIWKVFLTMNNAIYADINGDGHQELITSIQGTHKIFVWGRHSIPVNSLLIGMTVALILYLAGRRIRHGKPTT